MPSLNRSIVDNKLVLSFSFSSSADFNGPLHKSESMLELLEVRITLFVEFCNFSFLKSELAMCGVNLLRQSPEPVELDRKIGPPAKFFGRKYLECARRFRLAFLKGD